MNIDEIIKFAKIAGFYIPTPIDIRTQDLFMPKLEYFAKLITSEEREACAKVCESLNEDFDSLYVESCAEAIRARGEE